MSAQSTSRLNPGKIEQEAATLGVDELVATIIAANREYWDLDDPSLPDPLYDRLVERLRQLAPEHPLLLEMGPQITAHTLVDDLSLAPVLRLGHAVRHRTPMLSLEKCYDASGLVDWLKKIKGDILVMPKLDGAACSLHYDKHGKLVLAATRGSGTIGEDITVNVLEIADIPGKVALKRPQGFEVRGEVYLPLSTFTSRFAENFSHPRNLAAGTLKQKERGRCAEVGLHFYAYDIAGLEVANERDKVAKLGELGFRCDHALVVAKDESVAEIARFTSLRRELDYEIDGVVFRCADTHEYAALGLTGHHPKGAIAYKFQGESGVTTLRNVVWSVSRTGTITPVAEFEAVELSGAQLTRASLHNLTRFRELKLAQGSTIQVTRRGGVIPMVESVLSTPDDAVFFVAPVHCPACHGPVEARRKHESDFLYCVNSDTCVSARLRELEHFAKALDLQGFGPKVLAQAVDKGLLTTLDSFFRLEADDLAQLERLGQKSATNLIGEIQSHRKLSLPTFLQALGIEHLGKQNALLLAQTFGSLPAIRQVTREQLINVPGIKDAIADALVNGLANRHEAIDALLAYVEVQDHAILKVDAPTQGPLSGQTFLFTGALVAFERAKAEALVKELGGSIVAGVSKKLTFLVSGKDREEKSSKMTKALTLIEQGHKLRILSEEEFLALLPALPAADSE